MKDYRTWWMRGREVWGQLDRIFFRVIMDDTLSQHDISTNNYEISEQLWAEQEGLA